LITINITGTNDTAAIGGTLAGNVYEDLGTLNSSTNAANIAADISSGLATVTDLDNGQAIFQAVTGNQLKGTYGNFTFNNNSGAWTYNLDNTDPDTNALTTGQIVSDSLKISSIDGTANETINVVITGHSDHIWAVTSGDRDKTTIVGFTAGDYIDFRVDAGGVKGVTPFIVQSADAVKTAYTVTAETLVDVLSNATGIKYPSSKSDVDGILDSTQLTFKLNGSDTVNVTLQGYMDPNGTGSFHDNYHIV